MQVFRLFDMPDRVIAFNELPERLVKGFEMMKADGFPRHWKEWLGKKKRVINLPPEKDLLTGQVRYFDPITEEESFFYIVDWMVNPVVEKWKEVCDFVRQHVDKDTRLMEKLEDMAVPLAANKSDGVTLEPESVPIISIPLEYQEKSVKKEVEKGTGAVSPVSISKPDEKGTVVRCDYIGCHAEFDGSYAKGSLRFHMKKHLPEKVPA